MEKTLTTTEAWKKAAFYLKMCCGFPKEAKCKLYKSQQTYSEALNQHRLVFTLTIDHPVRIPNNKVLAENLAEPVWVYYGESDAFDGRPFEILKELIEILEIQCEAAHIERDTEKAMEAIRDKQHSMCNDDHD